jgi:hypothetical protein
MSTNQIMIVTVAENELVTKELFEPLKNHLLRCRFIEVKDERVRNIVLTTAVALKFMGAQPTAKLRIEGREGDYWFFNDVHCILIKGIHGVFLSQCSDPNSLNDFIASIKPNYDEKPDTIIH